MANPRHTARVKETDPVYRVVRPKLTIPRLNKTDTFIPQVVPNDMHWAAESGNINLLAELLIKNHDVEATDLFGRTPLHEAAENDKLQAADWLMFHGADPHRKDYQSSTPMSLSKSEAMTGILAQNSSYRIPEKLVLANDDTYRVKNLNIWFGTDPAFLPVPCYVMCKRQSPSKSSLRYHNQKGELFWRDVIDYKVSLVGVNTYVAVDILVIDLPQPSCELILKHENGTGTVSEIQTEVCKFTFKDTECWLCRSTIQLDNYGCFALCSRPKCEVMHVSKHGGEIVSKINSSIKFKVPAQAFKTSGNLLCTIEEVPEIDKDDPIMSLSHFFDIKHSTYSESSEDIEVTLPVPRGYTGEGEVLVLSRPGSAATSDLTSEESSSDDDAWELRDTVVNSDRRSVSFKTSRFGINAPLEVPKGVNREQIRVHAASIFSKRKECYINFLVVGKVLGFDQFDIVVECVKRDQIYLRIHDWTSDGYNKLRISGDFPSQYNQKYRIELKGNLKCVYGLSDLHLEVLPGQNSHQSLLVKVQNVHEDANGSISIHNIGGHGVSLVTSLPILLQEQLNVSQAKPKPTANSGDSASHTGQRSSRLPRRFNSFPSDPTTVSMSVPLDDGVITPRDEPDSRISLNFGDICDNTDDDKDSLLKSSSSLGNMTSLLHGTDTARSGRRQSTEHSIPAGVGSTVVVRQKGAQPNVGGATPQFSGASGNVENDGTGDTSSSVSGQATASAGASEGTTTKDLFGVEYGPVSDKFFAQLVRTMSPDFLLFVPLGLCDGDIKKIQRDTASLGTEYTMFSMLVECRKKKKDNVAFLHTLLFTFEEFGQNEIKSCAVELLRKWLQDPPANSQDITSKVKQIIQRFKDN